jgi:MerR family transcriptional regulator/heat shock protein HspR
MTTDEPTGGFYLIGIVAELAGMHPQTLRLYERRGLISPGRSAGQTRRYTDADLARLRRIQALSEAGLNLAGIERVLGLEQQLADATEQLTALAERLEAEHRSHREELDRVRRSMRAEVVLVTRGETALVPVTRRGTQNQGR